MFADPAYPSSSDSFAPDAPMSIPFSPSLSSSPAAALLLDGQGATTTSSPPPSPAPSPSAPSNNRRSIDAASSGIPRSQSAHALHTPTREIDSLLVSGSAAGGAAGVSVNMNGSLTPQPSQRQPQQRMVEVSLEQVSDHQFLSLLKMKFKKTRRQELELKELQRLFVLEEEERRKLAEENAVLTRRLDEERRLREAADSLASALRDDNERLNSQIEELNLRLVEIITNVSHMGVPPAEKAKVLKKAPKPQDHS
ncbi:uncharacterized protein ACA1_200540 [Acanthamoeba castellanii str. Neff]|uniref:Uncharacterized protein n=1 Tax=Acanthamoeba castellanii (strain ATCC 30010 / Neff) TaxID=1257118 RepID=L8H3C7_ACACF|nr:uncharacterized protein ACA1_200540 [Acanthamoeba castellanii str. Neff]ELR19737.1 hypothetical protein ACA1_200540 [Acanthamoeba castellanii str. Neff]